MIIVCLFPLMVWKGPSVLCICFRKSLQAFYQIFYQEGQLAVNRRYKNSNPVEEAGAFLEHFSLSYLYGLLLRSFSYSLAHLMP